MQSRQDPCTREDNAAFISPGQKYLISVLLRQQTTTKTTNPRQLFSMVEKFLFLSHLLRDYSIITTAMPLVCISAS